MPQFEHIRVAVIGHGHLGKWHAEKANHLANLVAIVEERPDQVKVAKEKFPQTKVVQNIHEVMSEIDAAIVVTPTSTHLDFLKTLMMENKHIFCEKPLCSNNQEALELEKLYPNYKGILQVGHSERFHESWELIERYQNYITGPSVIRMNRFAPFKGRASDVDVVQDLMIHDIDLLVYILGENPIKVRSTGHKIRTSNWDYVSSHFHFSNHREAFVVASRSHVKEVRDMEIFSNKGCLYVDLFHNQILVAGPGEGPDEQLIQKLNYQKRDHLMIEQEHFYRSISNESEAIVNFQDGLIAVKLISKVLEGLKTSQTVEI